MLALSTGSAGFIINAVIIIVAVVVAVILIKSGVLSKQVGIDAVRFTEAQATMQRQEIDIRYLKDQNTEKDETITAMKIAHATEVAALTAKVQTLQEIVTSRDLIMKGFLALGVRQEDLV